MTSRICCLKRLGEGHKKYKLIKLDQKDEVTVGRNPDVTVCILSAMISRCHALLKKTACGKWTITDNKSLNGVYINDKKLEPMTKHELKDGDIVQFGVKLSPENKVEEFIYKYFTGLKIRRADKPEDLVDGVSGKRLKLDENHQSEFVKPCSSKDDQQVNNNNGLPSGINDRVPMDRASPFKQYKDKLDEEQNKAAEKLAEMETKLKEMQQLLQEKDSAKEVMEKELKEEKLRRENQVKEMEDLQEKEKRLQQELEEKQKQLAREKEELEAKMKEELEDILQVKEATLMENLEKQRLALLGEKKEVENRLKKELESEREKDKKLTEELMLQKQKLEKVIEKKEAEQKMLENELNDTKNKKEHEQEEYLRAKEDILSNFAELMETELQCSICNELFVRATSLNCSHAFCSFCINQWMKVKKECPQCRQAITTHMRSIVLDSYIDKMVEQFTDELKESRRLLVEDRKKEEAKFEEANKPQPATRGGRGQGRRGRGRGRVRGGAAAAAQAPPPPPPPQVTIELSDDEDEDDDVDVDVSEYYHDLADSPSYRYTDSDDDDDEDEIDGDDGAYYGGYGRCYTCGSRGHWANGCPFR